MGLVWIAVAFAEPLEVGPVVARSGPMTLPEGLALATCLPTAPPAPTTASGGRITLVVRIRRNRVALVTTAQADPVMVPFAPCFERELATAAWPLRRGRVEVPIAVPPAEEE